MNIPTRVEDKIRAHALADLAPSNMVVLLKSTAASLLGGFLSLFFCGQFGISFGAFDLSGYLPMDRMTPEVCAVFCGLIFSVVPVLLMRFAFFSPLQFRAVIQRYVLWLMLPYALWLPILASHGDFLNMKIELGLWLIAAIFSTFLNGRLLKNFSFRLKLVGE